MQETKIMRINKDNQILKEKRKQERNGNLAMAKRGRWAAQRLFISVSTVVLDFSLRALQRFANTSTVDLENCWTNSIWERRLWYNRERASQKRTVILFIPPVFRPFHPLQVLSGWGHTERNSTNPWGFGPSTSTSVLLRLQKYLRCWYGARNAFVHSQQDE